MINILVVVILTVIAIAIVQGHDCVNLLLRPVLATTIYYDSPCEPAAPPNGKTICYDAPCDAAAPPNKQ